jgi:hypothetical protein
MPVANEHELYSEFKGDWEEVRDCVKGNRAIKKRGKKYLPMLSGQSEKSYNRYIKKVKFFGATGRTLDGLHGNIFRKAPEYTGEVSETFTESLNDVDLMGTNIEQFGSNVMYDCLQTNWGGILVDYPKGEEAKSLADAEAKGFKAYLKYYPAENVINWEYKTIRGKTQLSLVVLVELCADKDPSDEFAAEIKKIFRVLYLDKDTNTYKQKIYNETKGVVLLKEDAIDIKINSEDMNEIPFYPIPGKLPEKSMLYDLAQLNLQHYQDSADYQNGKHYTSIPSPIAIGLKPQLDENGDPKPMFIGGDQFQFFPNEDHVPGADVKYLEYTGVGMKDLANGIIHLESLMAILGAHIIAGEKKGVETAEALRIHRIGENGVLSAFTRNVSSQITKALRKKGEWDGEKIDKLNKWSINFNTDYDMSDENVQTLSILLTGRANGEIPRITIYLVLKSFNLIPEQWSFEDYLVELENDAKEILPAIKNEKEPDKQKEENNDFEDDDIYEEDD